MQNTAHGLEILAVHTATVFKNAVRFYRLLTQVIANSTADQVKCYISV